MTDTLERLTSALADCYTIEHEIGAGGMATVYLAHDVKHDRKVALKVLRPELAAVIGAERFLAEIKTTANLQHPHILALHDSGEVGGTVFYVMPFVEGESLRDQLNREKQLPVADAVRVATEVAGALDYAHRKGIIHRDIKPENILLHDGQALVADFGIALAAATTGGTRMTETGMSLGTPHYMSPEQAMGERELDARTDVYALGCVLYEMLTGDPPFTGSSAQAIVAKVMTEKPASIRGFRDTVPVEVEATVLTALNKLPADRFASAPEFATALTTPGHATTLAAAPASAAPATWLRDRRTIALATVAGLALVTAVATMGGGAEDSVPRPALFGIPLPEGLDPRAAALAPDGSSMVLLAADSTNQRRLYYRALDTPDVRPIAGTEGATAPFYAPDSRRVAFGARGALRVVTLPEGTPTVVPGTDRGMIDQGGGLAGGAWNAAGTIVFSPAFGQIGLWHVPESGGTPEHFSQTLCRPAFLPNDETLLCDGEQGLSLMSLSTGEETLLEIEGREPRYANGRIVFLRAGRPFVVEFDPHRQETVTEPVPVLGL
ncbi:MAG: serine/threonine-protein kinase, partial [Gemmatimonadales bacterium]